MISGAGGYETVSSLMVSNMEPAACELKACKLKAWNLVQ